MTVREKTPDKLLVSTDFLKSTSKEDEELHNTKTDYESSKNVFLALLGASASCVLTIIPSWTSWCIIIKVSMFLFTFGFTISTIWFLAKFLNAKSKLSRMETRELAECVIDETKKNIRYTALLIIAYQKEDGPVVFMTEKKGNYIIHCDMDANLSAADQKDLIINYLATTYSVPKKTVVDIIPLSEEPFFSIKPIHGETTQNGFIFFQVKLKKKIKQNLSSHKSATWKSIHEMEGDAELMGKNQDIVMALNENKTRIVDSFEDSYGPLHIIWNITKACPYSCAFCATSDHTRPELTTDEKLQVLNHIFSAKESISNLDFAGGDPMYDSGIREVIKHAIYALGDDRVSVTTTGKGIQAMTDHSEDEIPKLLQRCEITIDASHENLAQPPQKSAFSRNSPEYCSHNFEQIQIASDNLKFLMINIPLLDDDLNDQEIDTLLQKLVHIKNDYKEIQLEAQLIRMMPVGAFNSVPQYKKKYKTYNPINVAQKIKEGIDSLDISCRYHCSLRVLPALGSCDLRCNMLDKKIGIDCSGNVFACTWGAYVPLSESQSIDQNPFFLGNLVKSSLQSILNGYDDAKRTSAHRRITHELANQKAKPYCETVSWYFNRDIKTNNDPLSTVAQQNSQ